ncbi:MAG: phosphatidylserine decarboxylase [Candidatus Methanofastidiosa archaeon]|jgi:phosphatidylserine decarboxylase|nr:phosphatidylserine decarboxylase [Candidatus Methanofastidiosa archaeon]
MFLTLVVRFLKRKYTLFLSLVFIVLIAFSILFYRDPERVPPIEEGIIISPADGKVISIDTLRGNEIPFTIKNGNKIFLPELTGIVEGNYTVVSIFMNVFDVHVNRSPVSGQIEEIIYIDGGHSPAFGNVLTENERNIVVIDGEKRIVIVQIAGTIARRIDCYVSEDQSVNIGDKIGKIKLGSQVVVMYPSDYLTIVKIDDKVKAGETIIAETKIIE